MNGGKYIVKKFKTGYKTCKASSPKICMSKKPLSKKMAKKQMIAINLSELRKKGKIPPRKI